MPFGPWLERLDYAHRPIGPARRLLASITVADLLRQEIEHVQEHLEG